MSIVYNSQAWEKIHNPIFKKADKYCKSINAFEDVWYWYVAEETAKIICKNKIKVDKQCVKQINEWRDLGVCDLDCQVWQDFENHVKEYLS